jgi:Contractile injection system tube protein
VERVAFLIEDSGVRIGCLLNPESVVTRRTAGVRARRSIAGPLTGTHLADDPLIYTGGGRTELELDLVFDVALGGSTISSTDVRDLTAPLWQLAENTDAPDGYGKPSLVRFVWGKSWNVPGIIEAVAERLEYFTPEGAPQRSWLRMRLVRVGEPAPTTTPLEGELPAQPPITVDELPPIPPDSLDTHELLAGGGDDGTAPTESEALGVAPTPRPAPQSAAYSERLDDLAARYYGDPALWRLLAAYNDIDDPLRMPAGQLLRIPPAALVRRRR